MAVTERGLKQKEQIRDSILVAAETIVLKQGWQFVSIRKIAEAIGYSLPVVYNHFKNKDAILEEFVKQGFSMLSEVMVKAKSKAQNPTEQLTAMACAYCQFASKQKEYYQLMFGLGMPSCEKASQIDEIANFGAILIATIQELKGSNQTDDQTILKFHTLWSTLHGLSSINLVSLTATPNEIQQSVLLDAMQGFIKNINN